MASIARALALLLGAALGVAGLEPPSFSVCDINEDGVTNVVDVRTIIDQTLSITPATNDLNGDGFVNVVDVQIEVTAALGVTCLAGPPGSHTFAIGGVPVSIENSTSPAPKGPMTLSIEALPVAVENTVSPAPAGPMTFAVAEGRVSIENATSPAPTGSMALAVMGAPVSIENTMSPAPAGLMSFAVEGAPVSIENTTSPAPASPQTRYTAGLEFSIFNGIVAQSLQSTFLANSLKGLVPVDRTFLMEALARGARRIDGKPVCLDSDGDGLCDADEVIIGTSPFLADTDGDGYPDGLELALGSDPLDPHSIPDIRPPGYFATPPVSIHNTTLVAILTPRRQGTLRAADNR